MVGEGFMRYPLRGGTVRSVKSIMRSSPAARTTTRRGPSSKGKARSAAANGLRAGRASKGAVDPATPGAAFGAGKLVYVGNAAARVVDKAKALGRVHTGCRDTAAGFESEGEDAWHQAAFFLRKSATIRRMASRVKRPGALDPPSHRDTAETDTPASDAKSVRLRPVLRRSAAISLDMGDMIATDR